MLLRFRRERIVSNEYLIAGNQRLPIEYYGTIRIMVSTPNEPQGMILLKLAYVADFRTNIVSQDLLCVKGVYFDNWKLYLHRDGATVASVIRFNSYYLLEDNTHPVMNPSSAFSTSSSSSTAHKEEKKKRKKDEK